MNTLVVIDDEYIVIEAIRVMIKRAQLQVEIVGTANNGLDGLQMIRALQPDIVITDIRMPGLDGLSMIEQASAQLSVCAYIIISGYAEFQYAKRAVALSVLDYIEKPILIQNIVGTLERAEKHLEALRHLEKINMLEQAKQMERAETKNKAVDRVLAYIHGNYQKDIGLNELAEAAELTPVYLCKLFKECVGTPYIKYLTAIRVDQAKQMLQMGQKAMHVSQEIGYSDYHYFCRVFKKCTGMTPNEYKTQTFRSM